MTDNPASGDRAALVASLVDARLKQALPERLAQLEAERTPSMVLISTKGTLDMAYPPFILASTASALGWDVSIFFTFYGLGLLRRERQPAAPGGAVPGGQFEAHDRGKEDPPQRHRARQHRFTAEGAEDAEETIYLMKRYSSASSASSAVNDSSFFPGLCVSGVHCACQMTVDLFGYDKEDFVDGIADWVGAASFLPVAQKADVCLFI